MTRNGKIARLDRGIREELNRRLAANEPGGAVLEWLNGLPAVQALMVQEFEGQVINKQNLHAWRAGGFAEWEARQEILEQVQDLAADAGELRGAAGGRLTEHLVTVLAARYAALLAGWNGEADEGFERKVKVLRALSRDVVTLQKAEQGAERLEIERARLEQARVKLEGEQVEEFERWLAKPAVRELACQQQLKVEERLRRLQEIFNILPEEPEQPVEPEQVEETESVGEAESEGEPLGEVGSQESEFRSQELEEAGQELGEIGEGAGENGMLPGAA